ncbi:serine hydrolase domain-containing protein [Actinokineospora globicatena]|uniref:serine hydrolase domain-containing protein n=1 Tax=Actinokineospora globicatena TaxID=103729 RepID=UPI0020A37EDD|nr:serine hydrolase domain-containing protein [Actinokineospora globicatena]MCP2301965.1 CubicO group peptidase, beta-lactamase class C family [Actinokineospora globicatena]GLW76374.1 serine hydrolase [Actinokineospora globicatena]GLW83209.1 serine hydrolase [Actinokineospora globicatena]
MDQVRLARHRDVMARHVDSGAVPGIVSLLDHGGETHVTALGDLPAGADTIFRISSMTKPVTAVAALVLVEECVLRLGDPIGDLIPELAEPRVLRAIDSPLDDTVAARGPITVRHLLTSTFGHGVIMAPPGTYPVQAAIAAAGLEPGPPNPASTPDSAEFIRLLGTLPLLSQPGEKWWYDTAYDVLGVLIERAAGQRLAEFLAERVFAPLGMRDTGFHVGPDEVARLATAYSTTDSGERTVYDPAEGGQWSTPPAFQSGAGGLVSTAADYLAFLGMLRRGGAPVLSRPSVLTLSTDQLTSAQKAGGGLVDGFFDTSGWGFGVSVVTARDDIHKTPGRFGWEGGLGTSGQVDPAEDLITVLLTQQAWTSPAGPRVYSDFLTSAYQALD